MLRPSGDSNMLTIVKSPEGSQHREWSPAAKELTKDQRTVIAGGCMVSIKTTLPGGDVVYKQCGNGNVTPCDRHNLAAPAGFFAAVHADHPVHPLSSCADVEEFNFFHSDVEESNTLSRWEPLIRFVAVVGILTCLGYLAGSSGVVSVNAPRPPSSIPALFVGPTEPRMARRHLTAGSPCLPLVKLGVPRLSSTWRPSRAPSSCTLSRTGRSRIHGASAVLPLTHVWVRRELVTPTAGIPRSTNA